MIETSSIGAIFILTFNFNEQLMVMVQKTYNVKESFPCLTAVLGVNLTREWAHNKRYEPGGE